MLTVWAFDHIESKHTLYYGKDCMKKFCSSLREHATNVLKFEKKKMLPLTKEELKLHQDARNCYISGKIILNKLTKSKNYRKVRDYCHYNSKYRGAAHSISNLKFNVNNEIPVVFHNGSSYDYHFIMKILSNEFVRKFECLWENAENYKAFSVPIEKEITKIDKDGNEGVVTIP